MNGDYPPLRRVSGGLKVAVGFNPRGNRRVFPRRVSDGCIQASLTRREFVSSPTVG